MAKRGTKPCYSSSGPSGMGEGTGVWAIASRETIVMHTGPAAVAFGPAA